MPEPTPDDFPDLNPAHAFAGEQLVARFPGDDKPRIYRLDHNGVATEWRGETVE